MTVVTTHKQVPGAEVVWRELRAMRTFADLWGKYICGDLSRRTHVVDIGTPAPRTLIKGEAYWWALGFADARGDGDRVWALRQEKVPQLLTMDEAGERVPAATTGDAMTAQGVRRSVAWYPLNVPRPPASALGAGGRSRYVFEAQVEAEAARRRHSKTAEKAAQRWQALQDLLPPLVKTTAAGRDITPAESPDPLPIPMGRAEATRRADALRVGHHQGWFVFQYPLPGGGFLVKHDDGLVRELPGEGTLPWVLGFADAISPLANWPQAIEADLVAYRPGLG